MRQLEERYLERLSQLYPTIAKASTEIELIYRRY